MVRAAAIALAALLVAGQVRAEVQPDPIHNDADRHKLLELSLRYRVLAGDDPETGDHQDVFLEDVERYPQWSGERWDESHAAQFIADHMPGLDWLTAKVALRMIDCPDCSADERQESHDKDRAQMLSCERRSNRWMPRDCDIQYPEIVEDSRRNEIVNDALGRYDTLVGSVSESWEQGGVFLADYHRHPEWNGERWNLDHAVQMVVELTRFPADEARRRIKWETSGVNMDEMRISHPRCNPDDNVWLPRTCWEPPQ